MGNNVSEEFRGVDLGDKRLNRRLLKVAEALEDKPEDSICAAIGNFHDCKAAYRLFSNSKVTPEKISEPHVERSLERARDLDENLLVIHDSTDLVYGKFKSVKGLGVLTTGSGMPQGLRGIILHNSLLTSETGIPLGVIRQTFFTKEDYLRARGQIERNIKGAHKNYRVEEKGSWSDHLQSTHASCSKLDSEIVHVADRESDIYEFLQVAQDLGAKYVVRSMTNRRIKKGQSVRETSTLEAELAVTSPLGTTILEVQTEEGQNEQHQMAVKIIEVTLHSPQRNVQSAEIGPLKPLTVRVVEARSLKDPKLGWRLVTNLPCNTLGQAERVVNIYRQRWTIETYHRALKSGYGIEAARLGDRFRLENLCALLSILAWRMMWLYLAVRHMPHIPCSALFSPDEIRILTLSKHYKNKQKQELSAGEAILILAKMGGFLARPSDGPPGMRSIWKGCRALSERMEFLQELTYG